jgi:hypothetical protein
MLVLDKRISALEQKKTQTQEVTILSRIVWVGQQDAVIEQLRDEQGTSWLRGESEPEQDFVERVKAEAWRNEWGVMVLNGYVW